MTDLSVDQVRSLAYQCAGAGAGAVMRHAPDVVMLTKTIQEAVEGILSDFGVPAQWESRRCYREPDTACGSPETCGREGCQL